MQVGGRGDGLVDGLDRVAMAAPYGVFARLGWAVFGIDAAEAQAQHRKLVLAGAFAAELFAPDLAGGVEADGAQGGLVGQYRPGLGESVVVSRE